MKNIFPFALVALTLSLANCDNRNENDHPDVNNTNAEPADRTAVDNDWERERTDYRTRIQGRLDEMDREIEARRLERKAEKNAEKVKEYDLDIERREKDRVTLRERMDNINARTKENWAEFKKDVDDFFERSRNNDTTGNDHRHD